MSRVSNGKPPLARSPIRLRSRRKALQPTNTNTNTILTPPGSVKKSQLPTYNRAVEKSELPTYNRAVEKSGLPTYNRAIQKSELPTYNRAVQKSELPIYNQGVEKSELRPEYHTISCELRALANMVHQELRPGNDTLMADIGGVQMSPLFERGRLYDEYSARRNERLKRKKGGETAFEKKPTYDLGVRVESAKKRVESAYKFDGRRKSMVGAAATATPVAERREARTPRYSLRSSAAAKENKKPPLPVAVVPMMIGGERSSVGVSERKMGVKRVISRRV